MTDWRPIETAPSDGTIVIIYQRFPHGRDVVTAAWRSGRRMAKKNLWFEIGDDGEDEFSQPYHPSHWMPLPDPPSPKAEERQ